VRACMRACVCVASSASGCSPCSCVTLLWDAATLCVCVVCG
jgi:hypothetical protein